MHILLDKKGKEVGYLYNNVILLPGPVVAGVVLAHCVFTRKGEVKGKFFGNMLYNDVGEIVATEISGGDSQVNVDQAKEIMIEAWKVLALTKEHLCPWVVPTGKWSKLSLEKFLTQ